MEKVDIKTMDITELQELFAGIGRAEIVRSSS